MARLFTDGAEMGDMLFWDQYSGVVATTLQARSGSYAYYLSASGNFCHKSFTASSEVYLRFGYRQGGWTGLNPILDWRKTTTILGQIYVNSSTGKLELYVGGVSVDAQDTVLTQNTWYSLELHIKIADAPDGILELRLDGITVATFLGDTKPGTDTTIDDLYFHVNPNNMQFFVDDFALNDTTGGVDNSWCGDGHIVLLIPNAAGDVTQWVPFPSTGTNYDMVNDIPADGNATYVYQTGTNSYDLYNLTTTTLPTTIYRVWSEARAKDTVAEGGEISLLVKTNGVIYTGSSVSLLTSFTKQILGSVYTTNPQTGLAWSLSELDALQVGPMVRS